MPLPPNLTGPDAAVVVAIPADAGHFRVLRVTAAVVASDLLDVASIEDVQIGVEEAAALLLDAGLAGRLETAMWCTDDRLHVRLHGRTGPPLTGDDFRRTILDAVVDDLIVDHDPAAGTTTVVFVKAT